MPPVDCVIELSYSGLDLHYYVMSYIVHYSLNIKLCSHSKAYSSWKGILKVTLEAISVDNKPEELLDRCVKLVKVSSKMNCDFLEQAEAFSWCITLSQLTTLSQR